MTAPSERMIVMCTDDNLCGLLVSRLREAAPSIIFEPYLNVEAAREAVSVGSQIGCVLCMHSFYGPLAELVKELRTAAGERAFLVIAWMPPDSAPERRIQAFQDGVIDCIDSHASHEEVSSKLRTIKYGARAERARREANEHLAALLGSRSRDMHNLQARYECVSEATVDMLFTVEASTTQHRIIEANPAAAANLNVSPQQLVGEPLISFLPRDFVDILESNMRLVSTRKHVTFDLTFQGLDGSRYMRNVAAYGIEFDGQPAVQLVATQRRIEIGPPEESGRFRLMASRTGQVVYEMDVGNNVMNIGGAFRELTGYEIVDRQRFPISRWRELVHPDDLAGVLQTIRDTLSIAGKWQTEYRLRYSDGSFRHVEDTGVCIPGKDGRAARVVGTIKDITHRIEAEENRRRLHEEGLHSQKLESLGVLAGGIAHDFNNILAAIIGLTALALHDIEEGTPLHEDLSEVLQAGNRAKELVRQILMFSRQQDTERVPVQLHLVAGEVLKLVRATAPPNVRIVERFDHDAGNVLANPAQLHQVIMNYCTNAVHAVRQRGGVIQVIIERLELGASAGSLHPRLTPGAWIRLAVTDDGHGMSEHVRQRIFDPFFTTKPPGEGTGMGLAVVHGIVSEHRGVVDVQSRPGSGTVFYTYFPAAEVAPPEVEPASQETPSGIERILTVIPEQMVARFANSTLKRLGYEVVEARNASEAIKRLQDAPGIDALIADTRLDDATLEQLLKLVWEAVPGMRLLLLAGPDESGAVEPLTEDERVHMLRKPMSFEELARATRNLLDAAAGVSS
ncbi:MAG: PAS domain-containing protein [Candidatus Hydrogenedens sp.]|nr:PAS domain-containing protein [Candidatus Hydrogenedens sp.]